MTAPLRWAWAEISLAALRHNVMTLQAHAAPRELWAVVKADAYGHGAVQVATTALDSGASGLCVALADEGAMLRAAGIEAPILVMSEQPQTQHQMMVSNELIATVYNSENILNFAIAAMSLGRVAKVHLKVDTGMHRVGVPVSEAVRRAQQIVSETSLQLDGVYTHFATADLAQHGATEVQHIRFLHVVNELRAAAISPPHIHVANSAATVREIGAATTMVRAGIALYGIPADPVSDTFGAPSGLNLSPVLSLRARVSHVQWLEAGEGVSYGLKRELTRRTCIATLPLGYADGVRRELWKDGNVLINGQRRAFAGVVTMDQVMIDCGSDQIEVGQEAVLIGVQGNGQITANEWARHLDTIGYEITCAISPRIPRRYVRLEQ